MMTILEPMSSGVIVVKFAADFVAVWFPPWLGGGSSAVVRREEKAWAADLSHMIIIFCTFWVMFQKF